MTALDRPCQVLAEGTYDRRNDDDHAGGRRYAGSRVGSDAEGRGGGSGRVEGRPEDRRDLEEHRFEQTTHVTLTITTDSATHQPGLYLRYRDTFPNPEAAARYEQRVQDWLATRPDPADEAPAPVYVDQPKALHEILEFNRDDHIYVRPQVVPRPFDQERE